jgi:diadenylate cyclase
LEGLWAQLTELYYNVFYRPDWRDVLDILIVATIIYQLLRFTRQTRGSSVFKGFVVILIVTWISAAVKLRALNWVLVQLINTGAVLLVVIFQPELRRALEQIGRGRIMGTSKARSNDMEIERIVNAFVDALTRLARRRVGALIVIEGNTGLKDVIESGTLVDARISSALIENIFEPNTPLHDGAVVVRGESVYAAACILPLTDDQSISRDLGTRHRAAIGVTETTDAIALVVSEETGVISMARGGKLSRYLDAKSLSELLHKIYGEPQPGVIKQLLKRRPGK